MEVPFVAEGPDFFHDVRDCYMLGLSKGDMTVLIQDTSKDQLAVALGVMLTGLRMVYSQAPESPFKEPVLAYFRWFEDPQSFKSPPLSDEPSGDLDAMGVILTAIFHARLAIMEGFSGERESAWHQMSEANFWHGMLARPWMTDVYPSDEIRLLASSGGKAMHAASGKQVAKAKIYERFQRWQAGQEKYASGAAFAREMINDYAAIMSVKVVETWVTRWRAEAKRALRQARPVESSAL